jgi:four helix bundle protein
MGSDEKVYDLESRTYLFAKHVSMFVATLPKTLGNIEYIKQVIRSSGSVGANYIEANEALSKKDFLMRVKIARKEAKETEFWLRLLVETNSTQFTPTGLKLLQEAGELKKILSAILLK